MQHGPSHRAGEYAKAMAPDPFPQDRLDFQKRGFLDKQYEELEPLRCEDKRHNGYCNCVHVISENVKNASYLRLSALLSPVETSLAQITSTWGNETTASSLLSSASGE